MDQLLVGRGDCGGNERFREGIGWVILGERQRLEVYQL